MSKFEISEGKGFHMTFSNNWHISVQFGRGNLCSRRDTANYEGDYITLQMTQKSLFGVNQSKNLTLFILVWIK